MFLKKLIRRAAVFLLLVSFAGFFAFTTMVWNPFEGDFPELRNAIPRNVDFFAAKADLSDDFEDFPVPWFWSSFEASPAFPRVKSGDLARSLMRERGGERILDRIAETKEHLASIPVVGLDILEDLFGREVAVAGRLKKSGDPDWCLYTRVSWKIRAALGLLHFEGIRSRIRGVRLEWKDPLFVLEPPGAPPVRLALVRDLLIVGNEENLVRESYDLAAGRTEADSLVASSDYQDQVVGRIRDWQERNGIQANRLEYNLDLHSLAETRPSLPIFGTPTQDDPMELRLLHRFVNTRAMYRAWGNLVFAPDGLVSLLTVDLDRAALTPTQNRFLAQQPGHRDRWLKRLLLNVPASAAVVGVLRMPASVFLSEVFGALDEDSRALIDEGLIGSGQRGGVKGLVARLAPAFEPTVVVVVRNNDYPKLNVKFKVAMPSPVPAVAWIFKVAERQESRVHDALDWFVKNRGSFGFEPTVYDLTAGDRNLSLVKEYPNPQIPGTGEIAVVRNAKGLGGLFMVGNSGQLLAEIINTRFSMPGTLPLTTEEGLQECLETLPETVSGFAWFRGDGIRAILGRYEAEARRRLEQDAPDPGWMFENRPQAEKEVFRRHFAGKYSSAGLLPPGERRRFDRLVDEALELRWKTEEQGLRGKSLHRRFAEIASYMEFLDSGFLYLKNRERDLTLETRVFLRF